jgi:hypothetical protein
VEFVQERGGFGHCFFRLCCILGVEGFHCLLVNHGAIPSSRRKEKASKTEKVISWPFVVSLRP